MRTTTAYPAVKSRPPTKPYTKWSEGAAAPQLTPAMDRHIVLRAMMFGFGLMVLLVLGAGYFGYAQSRAIQASAQTLIREHLLTSERAAGLEARIEEESSQLLDELAWLLGACLILAIGGAGFTIWITNRSFQRLERQTEELNQVSWNLVDSHEKIARRFSHEIHDELGQALTGLKSLLKRTDARDFDARREEILETLDEVMRDVRELSQLLRPVILDDFGLDAGLRGLCDRLMQRTPIQVHYDSNVAERLPEQAETHLFRIAQEALTNIARHSGASEAFVRLWRSGRHIELTIEDNGGGIAPGANAAGFGMVGMRARIRQLQGTLAVEHRAEGGLRVRARAPLRQDGSELGEKDL